MPVVAAFATSHAYTFQEPETWDQRRERSKANVARKTGRPASDTREARAETLADNRERLLELVKSDIPRFRKIIQDIGIQPE